MTPSELFDRFRSDVVDLAKPYLWTDDEVWSYLSSAHAQFIRLTGGIADFLSDATQVQMITGERVADLDKSILHIDDAFRVSDGAPIKVINLSDPNINSGDDYGIARRSLNISTLGPVRYMVIGRQRDKCEWLDTPAVDDVAQLTIRRMPLALAGENVDEFEGVEDDRVINLLDWMKHLAYKKQDADTFDKAKSDDCAAAFERYCFQCTREWNRYKHKTRIVSYGGL